MSKKIFDKLTRTIIDGVKKVEVRGRTSEESQRIVRKKWKEEIAGWINYTPKNIHKKSGIKRLKVKYE